MAGSSRAAGVFTALGEQTVVVAGTEATGIVPPQLAGMLKQLCTARDELLTQLEVLVAADHLLLVRTSMPAVGVRAEASIITGVAGKEFQTAGHLVSYACLAPATGRSGTSIRGDHPGRLCDAPSPKTA